MTTALAPVRKYNFSDGRLIELCLEKIAFAERDATELATVGVTATWVEDFEEQVLAFGAMPTDTIELGEQKEATEEKEEEADELMDKLKELRSAAKRALGEKSSAYGKFGFLEMDKFGDRGLSHLALVIPALTTKYAAQLATKGWDAADNTELQTLFTAFVGGMQNQVLEIGSRDSATEDRIEEGNIIFDLLDNELCEAGKGYWRTRSEAKYNDYFIFNNESGSGGVVKLGSLMPGQTAEVDITGITFTPTGPDIVGQAEDSLFRIYFATNPGDLPLVPWLEVNDGETSTPVEPSDIGFSPSRTILLVHNAGTGNGNWKLIIG